MRRAPEINGSFCCSQARLGGPGVWKESEGQMADLRDRVTAGDTHTQTEIETGWGGAAGILEHP